MAWRVWSGLQYKIVPDLQKNKSGVFFQTRREKSRLHRSRHEEAVLVVP